MLTMYQQSPEGLARRSIYAASPTPDLLVNGGMFVFFRRHRGVF